MRLTRMVTGRRWRRVPRVTAGTAAVVLLAGLASGAGAGFSAPAAGSHAGTAARRAPATTAMKYRGVIGAPPSAVETAAQAPAPPPIDLPGYQACVNNPQDYKGFLQGSAYVAGWSNASKLGGSTHLGSPAPALASGSGTGGSGLTGEGWVSASPFPLASNSWEYGCGVAKFQLDYQGRREFPPLQATFLGFGFMPVTATVQLTQVGSVPVTTIALQRKVPPADLPQAFDFTPSTVVSTSDVSLRLSDVKVNGVSLDVGGNCHTTGPLTSPNPINYNGLVLTGGDQPGDPLPWYAVSGGGIYAGGALAGEATIPPFTGCVTPGGDNLNALLDSSVSGPGNYVRLTVAPLCYQLSAVGTATQYCSQGSMTVPANQPSWTVTHGTRSGGYTASGPVMIETDVGGRTQSHGTVNGQDAWGYVIGCTDSSIRVTIPDASGVLRDGALGSLTWTSFGGCGGYSWVCGNGARFCGAASQLRTELVKTDDSHWTITQDGTAYLDGLQYDPGNNPPATGAVALLNTDDVVLNLTGTNVPVTPGSSTVISCTAQLTESIGSGQYSNSGSALTIGAAPTGRTNGAGGLSVTKGTCPESALVGFAFLDGIPGTEGDVSGGGFSAPPGFYATYHLGGTMITSP